MSLKYFKKKEFTCSCGCGQTVISDELLEMLDMARELAKIPFVISSGYRCKEHNENLIRKGIKASKNSAHLKGLAADIKCKNSKTRALMVDALGYAGFTRMGLGKTFIHVDIDNKDKPSPSIWLYNQNINQINIL